MRHKGEWEPDPEAALGSWPAHVIVRAHCGRCGHSADVDGRHVQRLPPAMPVREFRARLACNFCPTGRGGGKVTVYLRKKPRD